MASNAQAADNQPQRSEPILLSGMRWKWMCQAEFREHVGGPGAEAARVWDEQVADAKRNYPHFLQIHPDSFELMMKVQVPDKVTITTSSWSQ